MTAAGLSQRYDVPAGRVEIDLTAISDIESLDGRALEVDVNAGEIVLILPDDVALDLTADVGAGGEIVTPDEAREGWDVSLESTLNDDEPRAEVEADLSVGFGRIEVRTQ